MSEKTRYRTAVIIMTISALLSLIRHGGLTLVGFLCLLALYYIVSCGRRKRRQALASRLAADPRYLVLSTNCLMDWEALTANFDGAASRPLLGLVNCGCQDGRIIRPVLEKVVPKLKRLAVRHPKDPGPKAYLGWSLALLNQLDNKEKMIEEFGEAPETGKLDKADAAYQAAAGLAGPDLAGGIWADWARIEEQRAEMHMASDRSVYITSLKSALKKYEKAVDLDSSLAWAWRGRGRVLGLILAEENENGPPADGLFSAVDYFEAARRERQWDGDFYDEFGWAVYRLAEYGRQRQLHYYQYAARLYTLAAEMKDDQIWSMFMAGKALFQAAEVSRDSSKSFDLYRQSLDCFKLNIQKEPGAPVFCLWIVRCSLALFHLPKEYGGDLKVLEEAARCCAQAALAMPGERIYSDWAHILSTMAENDDSRALELWTDTAEKYRQAVECDDLTAERAAVNWHNWGYALHCQAHLTLKKEEKVDLLRRASLKYEKAAEYNDNNFITMSNWGDVLGDLAETFEEPEKAGRFFTLAEEKYRQATELHQDQAAPWRRWSILLQNRAKTEKTPARRRELWQSALDKLEQGAKAEPEDADTWILWGQTLVDLYRESPEYERPLLAASVMEKYEKAASIDPENDETWHLLGRARLEATELPEDVNGDGALLSAHLAAEHFSTACRLKPNSAEYWAEWGRALFKVSQIVDNEASSMAALNEARDKYETAVALDSADSSCRTGLGHVFYQWGWRLEEIDEKRVYFQKAYDNCREAGRLAPHDPTVWRNWARVAEALAGLERDPGKSFDWQNEADEKHYQADALEASGDRARRH